MRVNNRSKEDADAYQGLFGYVGGEAWVQKGFGSVDKVQLRAVIKNLNVVGTVSSKGKYTGGIAGFVQGAHIIGCSFRGRVENRKDSVSGAFTGSITGQAAPASTGVVSEVQPDNKIADCEVTAISNVVSYSPNGAAGGIVGYSTAEITNCVNNANVTMYDSVSGNPYSVTAGGIAGIAQTGQITDCRNNGTVDAATNTSVQVKTAGGITGALNGRSRLEGCENSAAVKGSIVGGITGALNGNSEIKRCKNTAAAEGSVVGGIAGEVSSGTISEGYNTGAVIGDGSSDDGAAGGICGTNRGTLTDNYNAGAVSGEVNAGGVCGYNYSDINTSCNTGDISGNGISGGVCGINNGSVFACFTTRGELCGRTSGGSETFSSNQEEAVSEWDFNEIWINNGVLNRPMLKIFAENYCTVSNANDLKELRDYVNAGGETQGITIRMNCDIDLGGENWTPIGIGASSEGVNPESETAFLGTFDGNGHTIYGLCIDDDRSGAGLFGYNGGTIKRLHTDCDIHSSGNAIGGIVGYNIEGGVIEECYTTGYIQTIEGSDGLVDGQGFGGIAGYNSGTIRNCYNIANVGDDGNIHGESGSFIGGITGVLSGGLVENCYNNCIREDNTSDFDVYSRTQGNSYVGGIAGFPDGELSGNFFLKNSVVLEKLLIGSEHVYDEAVIIDKNQMADKSTFTNAGWDFENVWEMRIVYGKPVRPVLKAFHEPVSHKEVEYRYLDGDGTESNPCLISSLEDLEMFWNYMEYHYKQDGYYLLTEDIDMLEKYGDGKGDGGRNKGWIAIAGDDEFPFRGVFEGGGHTINMYMSYYGLPHEGLFGYNNGTIRNLNLTGKIASSTIVGAVAGGNLADGRIENCSSQACITTASYSSNAGGITGENKGIVESCVNSGAIEYTGTSAGIAALGSGTIINCKNSGKIGHPTAYSKKLGGIIGLAQSGARIINCENSGEFSRLRETGGGIAAETDGAIIENCLNTETGVNTRSTSVVGGIVGTSKNSSIIKCGNQAKTTSSNDHGGIVGIFDSVDGVIENCYNTGYLAAAANHSTGGIVGILKNGKIKNSYNIGGGVASGATNAIIGTNENGIAENCYYSPGPIGEGERLYDYADGTNSRDLFSFSNGEMARLLNENAGSDGMVWGQNLYAGGDQFPVLTSDSAKAVYKTVMKGLSGYSGYTEDKIFYSNSVRANSNGINFNTTLPSGYNWSIDPDSFVRFDMTDAYDRDLEVYPVIGEMFKGSGTQQSPYEISDIIALLNLAKYVNSGHGMNEYFKQTADIIVKSSDYYIPIGKYAGSGASYSFKGTFDGDGHTITLRGIRSGGTVRFGVFGQNAGTIKNLTVNGTVYSGDYSGAIAGYNTGIIENCASGIKLVGDDYTGGIAGANAGSGVIRNCVNTGSLENRFSTNYLGGIVGLNAANAVIEGCRNEGTITITSRTSEKTGGIAGENGGTITGSVNTGKVNGRKNTGGIAGSNSGKLLKSRNAGYLDVVGYPDDTFADAEKYRINTGGLAGINSGEIENSYSEGVTIGTFYVGGLVGLNTANIRNCYHGGSSSGNSLGKDYVKSLAGKSEGTIENCYFYIYTNSDNNRITSEGEGTAAKSQEQFRSGEVAWLLQNGQSEQVWGQELPDQKMPVLTDSTEGRIYKTEFMREDASAQGGYAVDRTMYSNKVRADVPEAPEDHYWSADLTGGVKYDFVSGDENDVVLYPIENNSILISPTEAPVEETPEPAATVSPTEAPVETPEPTVPASPKEEPSERVPGLLEEVSPTEAPVEETPEPAATVSPTQEPVEEIPEPAATVSPTEEPSEEMPEPLATVSPTEAPSEEIPEPAATVSPTEEPLEEIPEPTATVSPTEAPVEETPEPAATVSPTEEPSEEIPEPTATVSPTEKPVEETPEPAATVSPTEEPSEKTPEPAATVSPTDKPSEETPEPAETASPTEETEIPASGEYKDKIVVKKEIKEDKAVFKVQQLDNVSLPEAGEEGLKVRLFMAEYNDEGCLIGVKLGEVSVDGSEITITSDLPKSDNYKFMLWNDMDNPLIKAITDIY